MRLYSRCRTLHLRLLCSAHARRQIMNETSRRTTCSVILPLVMLLALMGSGTFPTVTAMDYYVSPDGRDGDPGTISLPWRTLAKANRTLQAGDTLLIRQGVYDEVIEPFHSGLPGQPIVYRCYRDEHAILRGQPNAKAIVSIGWEMTGGGWDGKSYIVIEGLRIQEHYHEGKAAAEYPTHVLVYGVDSRHNEIRNCFIVRNNPIAKVREYGEIDYGISISKSSDNLIEGNHIQGMTRIGIMIGGKGRRNIVRDNVVLDCISSSIGIGSSEGAIQGTLIEGNVLGGSITEDGIQFEPDYNLEFDDGTNQGVIIRDNVIFENAENAIDLKGASNVVIEGNCIYGNRGDNEGEYEDEPDRNGGFGGIMHGNNAGSKDVIVRGNILYDNRSGIWMEQGYKVYNNVIVYNNRDYTGPDSNYGNTDAGPGGGDASALRKPSFTGVWLYSRCAKVAVLNNIVGGHHSAEISLGPNAEDSFRIDRNLYFNDVETRFAFYRGPYDWNTGTFASWTSHLLARASVTGADANSLVVEPLFLEVSEFSAGYRPVHRFCCEPGPPAIDSGCFLTRTSSAGSGARIELEDVGFFCNGFGVVTGDIVQLEGRDERYRITHLDSAQNVIEVDRSLEWREGQGIALPYSGRAPDIGVCEHREDG